MTSIRAAIDDPEVRQQHRRQVHQEFAKLLMNCASVWGLALACVACAAWSNYGHSAPARVVSADAVHDRVELSYADDGQTVYAVVDAYEAGSYRRGDRVKVRFDSDTGQPDTIDRSVLRNQMLVVVACFTLSVLIGAVPIARRAGARRRCLTSPWLRVHGESRRSGSHTFLPDVDDGSCWKPSAPLSAGATFDADIAREPSHRLVMRIAGSPDLVLAIRPRHVRSERRDVKGRQAYGWWRRRPASPRPTDATSTSPG